MTDRITSMPPRLPGEDDRQYHVRSAPARLVDRESWHQAHMKKDRKRYDKRTSLKEAVSHFVQDGDIVADSGFTWVRGALQATFEIIRQGKKDLSMIGSPLAAAGPPTALGVVRYLHNSYTGGELRGMDRMFDRAVREKKAEIVSEWSHGTQALGFKAAQLGLPFVACKQLLGSDMLRYNPYVKVIDNPLQEGSDPVCLVPALYPDVVFIHVQQADKYGNARIWGPLVNDVALAVAARKVVLTCEEIVPESEMRNNQAFNCIPFFFVDAVVELPYGALPGSCPGYYYWHREWWEEAVRVAGKDVDLYRQWAEKYIYGCRDHFDFIDKLGGGIREIIRRRKLTLVAEGKLEIDSVDYAYQEVTPQHPAWQYPWEDDYETEKRRLLEQIERLNVLANQEKEV